MGFFDRLFGRGDAPETQQPQQYQQREQPRQGQYGSARQEPGQLTDEQAIARYRYMLQTAPPETIEQAHAEAFERLTPEQRRMVLQELSSTMPEHERRALGAQPQDDPRTLARMATRAEMRQPGTMERTFNNMPNQGMGGGGIGMGGLMAGTFFSSFAGMFLGSMIAQQFFGDSGYNDGNAEGYQEGDASNDAQDTGDAGTGADTGGSDASYGDAGGYGGGDYGGGDFGGDFGGGDFGGGDF